MNSDNPDAIETDDFDNPEPTGFERPCPMCSGTGQREFQDCWLCDGEGYL